MNDLFNADQVNAVELFADFLIERLGFSEEIRGAVQDFLNPESDDDGRDYPSDDFPMYLEYDDWKDDMRGDYID